MGEKRKDTERGTTRIMVVGSEDWESHWESVARMLHIRKSRLARMCIDAALPTIVRKHAGSNIDLAESHLEAMKSE